MLPLVKADLNYTALTIAIIICFVGTIVGTSYLEESRRALRHYEEIEELWWEIKRKDGSSDDWRFHENHWRNRTPERSEGAKGHNDRCDCDRCTRPVKERK